jgi:hypothetical protein
MDLLGRSKTAYLILIPGLVFWLFGAIWAISSPQSASADDDFHLTSIWCAGGENKSCQYLANGNVAVPQELNSSLLEVGITGNPPCFVDWVERSESAGCLEKSGVDSLVESSRVNKGYNPPLFYKTLNIFVIDESIEKSIRNMKIFNVTLFSLLLILIKVSSNRLTYNYYILSLGVGLTPIGVILIGSTNPSSWVTMGLITYPVFLHNLLQKRWKINRYMNIFGLIISTILTLGSRFDGYFFILLVSATVLLNYYVKIQSKAIIFSIIAISFVLILSSAISLNLKFGQIIGSYFDGENSVSLFGFPKENMSERQPNSVINLFLEIPSYFASFAGAQKPIWVQPQGNLGRNFGYGIGWLEFNFPSITGIFLTLIVFYILLASLKNASFRKLVSLSGLILGVVALILFMRARYGFINDFYFQTRYLFPIFIVFLFISFNYSQIIGAYFTKIERTVIFLMIFMATSVAWLFYISRYSSGLNFPYTTFASPIEWWPISLYFGKLKLFLLFLLLNLMWLYLSVLKPLSKKSLVEVKN